MADKEDAVRLLLLLCDSDKVNVLELDERPDSEINLEEEFALVPAALVLSTVPDVRFVLAMRPGLDVCTKREEISDTSERLDESSEMEVCLVLEMRSNSVDRAVVDFCSMSGCVLIVTTLRKNMKSINHKF